MVARDDWRRRAFLTRNFDDPGEPVLGPEGTYVCRQPAPIQAVADLPTGTALPIGLVSNDHDDVYIVPGRLVIGRNVTVSDLQPVLGDQIALDIPEGQDPVLPVVGTLTFSGESPNATEQTIELLGRLREARFLDPTRRPEDAVAPLYGFISHQTSHTPDVPKNPNTLQPLNLPADGVQQLPRDTHVLVIDTGVWNAAQRAGIAQQDDVPDPLFRPAGGRVLQLIVRVLNLAGIPVPMPSAGGPFLGRAAGHGTFIRGLIRQMSPEARVTVRRAISVEGLVDERRLSAELLGLLNRVRDGVSERPDVIVLACGGAVLKWRDGQQVVGRYSWRSPLLLAATIDLVLQALPECVIVVSAGNDASSDPCYPAAFAAPLGALDGAPVDDERRTRIISVAAVDAEGWKARFSNYGPWVRASTIGVRLVSDFVPGSAAPDSDPDQPPQVWLGPDPIAVWTGTSFAAAVVAGALSHQLAALRAGALPSATAIQAWQTARVDHPISEDFGCGVAVPAGGVARLGPANTQIF